MTNQIKNNLDNYSQIINDDGNNMKEYNSKIKKPNYRIDNWAFLFLKKTTNF